MTTPEVKEAAEHNEQTNHARRSIDTWFSKHGSITVLVVAALSVVAACFIGRISWEVLQKIGESPSETLRNLGLLAAVPPTIILGVWRNSVNNKTAESAQRQTDIRHMSLLDERYQLGAELLANKNLATRVSGIGILSSLAREHTKEYLTQVVEMMCAYVQHPPTDSSIDCSTVVPKPADEDELIDKRRRPTYLLWRNKHTDDRNILSFATNRPRQDVVMALSVAAEGAQRVADIFGDDNSRSKLLLERIELSSGEFERIDLTEARLGEANFSRSLLLHVMFVRSQLDLANFAHAHLISVNLAGARLSYANLTYAYLENVDLTGASLAETDLTGANFVGITGLTQSQLDNAVADPSKLPNLNRTLDATSGKELQWRGSNSLENA